GEGSGIPTEPHHTPAPEVTSSHPSTSSIPLPSIPTAPIPPVTQTGTTPIIQYKKRARIAQSSALPTIGDEPASPVRDDSQKEACPTDSGFIADQDRATIAKSFTLPRDSAPRVTSPAAKEGKNGLIKRLLYDNLSPSPLEEFISKNSDTEIESFSPFPIPVEDSNSLREEIDLSFTPDDLMPSGIEDDEYDSERDILILGELLSNYSLSLPENESFHFDIPSSSRPLAKPPDGNSGISNVELI
nr:hypothetical protein [Tanacetum cinerariifolium]